MAQRPPFAIPTGTYNTPLSQMDEFQFRDWVQKNRVPFNPDAASSDYDMRGFFRAVLQGSPLAQSAINPNDNRMHFTDYFKTPEHPSFSNESQYAGPGAPQWINDSQLGQSGRVVYDEQRAPGLLDLFNRKP